MHPIIRRYWIEMMSSLCEMEMEERREARDRIPPMKKSRNSGSVGIGLVG